MEGLLQPFHLNQFHSFHHFISKRNFRFKQSPPTKAVHSHQFCCMSLLKIAFFVCPVSLHALHELL